MNDAATAQVVTQPTMQTSVPAFTLDCWRVYPGRHLLQHRRETEEIRQLEPRLMRLLCLLARDADNVVTREIIITELWPHVVVNENSLTRAVSDLRKMLAHPDGSRAGLIQTVPKRGYRLTVRPVALAPNPAAITPRPVDDKTAEVPAADSPVATISPVPFIRRWSPALAASIMLAITLLLQLTDQGPDAELLVHQSAQPPVQQAGMARHEELSGLFNVQDNPLRAVSPEAATLATALATSVDPSEDDFAIAALDSADTGTLQNLHGNAPGSVVTGRSLLTPDGQLLAYVDYQNGVSSLNLRPTMSAGEPWTAFTTEDRIFHLQWSPLDAGILITVGEAPAQSGQQASLRLMLLDLDTLTLHELYRRDLPAGDNWLDESVNLI